MPRQKPSKKPQTPDEKALEWWLALAALQAAEAELLARRARLTGRSLEDYDARVAAAEKAEAPLPIDLDRVLLKAVKKHPDPFLAMSALNAKRSQRKLGAFAEDSAAPAHGLLLLGSLIVGGAVAGFLLREKSHA